MVKKKNKIYKWNYKKKMKKFIEKCLMNLMKVIPHCEKAEDYEALLP